MKIKEQTRKLAAGCSKHCFEVVDETDEVSNHTYGKATLTRFEFDFRRVLSFHIGSYFIPCEASIDSNEEFEAGFLSIQLFDKKYTSLL